MAGYLSAFAWRLVRRYEFLFTAIILDIPSHLVGPGVKKRFCFRACLMAWKGPIFAPPQIGRLEARFLRSESPLNPRP
jgi:hypothetical protein